MGKLNNPKIALSEEVTRLYNDPAAASVGGFYWIKGERKYS